MAVVIGIDGGGTKTKGLLADDQGNVYGTALAGPSNPNAVSRNELNETIQSIFNQLKEQSPEQFKKVQFCFAGMAGVGEGKTKNALHDILKQVCEGYQIPYKLHNDGVNALFAGTFGEPGIVLISGTGSITYGLTRDGQFKRVGGWGYLFDDFGSGYDLGRQALIAVFQQYDGRGKETVLTPLLKHYFEVEDVPSIVAKVYQSTHPRSVIAPLSRLVLEAFDAGDDVANEIVLNAAEQLTTSIKTMQRRISVEKTPHHVILSGGIFERADVLIPIMKKNFSHSVGLKRLEHEPVIGAVVAALRELNIKINHMFKTNIKKIN